MNNYEIDILRRKDINEEKWNDCIRNDPKGLIYSYTWFLDCLADDWIGMVAGDYEQVMPLPFRKKYGICYVYKPPFIGQLGVFGKEISPAVLNSFLASVPPFIRYVDYPVNQDISPVIKGFTSSQEINYVLDLDRSYDQLKTGFKENAIRNIEKNKESGQIVKPDNCAETVKLSLEKFTRFSNDVIDGIRAYEQLDKACPPENRNINYSFVDEEGKTISATSIMRSNGRIYYLLSATTEKGKTIGASHKLAAQIIRDFAGSPTIFDFEGSNIPGIARFYEGFGARPEFYQQIKMNRLPPLLKLFKS